MANELIKMKTGLISSIEKDENTGRSPVALNAGTIYFAVDEDKQVGKILYDVDNSHRVVMSTQAEYADKAGEAKKTIGISGIYPVIGTQTTTTASWTGAIEGVTELFDGLTIAYYLPRTSANNVTLTLTLADGTDTAAIPVYYSGTSRMTTHYGPGSTIILTYWSAGSISVNGAPTTENRWTHSDYDSTNIFQLRVNYGGFKPTTALYPYQLLLTKNETDLIPVNAVNNSTATNKSLTTEEFNPFGQIYYWNTTGTVNANTVIGDWTSLHTQVLMNLAYSFNIGTTLTANKAVYLVATIQPNGKAKLSSTPITQTLPNSANENIYIYLGQAQDGSQIELVPFHPIYCYKDEKIVPYTGEPIATSMSSGLMSASDKAKMDAGITLAGNAIDIGDEISADTLRTSLGLSNAMHFIGHATVAITDNSTTDPEILNYDFGVNGANAKAGDVIIDKDTSYEYVWSSLGRWEKLGPDSYGLSISGHTVSLVYGGTNTSVTVPDNNTWNKVSTSQDGYISKLSGNANQYLNGNGQWTTPPNDNDNTTYGLSINGHTVSLVEGGTTTSVTIPDNNTWQANSSSQNGYVTSGSGQVNKVWKTDANGNPAWRDDANNTYSLATNTNLGLVKPWYNHTAASTGPTAGSNNTAVTVNTISTTAGKYYAIESDSNGRLFVNVPWTDNNTWQANTATQAGYVASPNSAANKVWKTDGSGVPGWRNDANNTYSLATYNNLGLVKPAYTSTGAATLTTAAASNTTTPTIEAKTTTANRYYGVEADKNGVLFVNVPWTDNNTWQVNTVSQNGYVTAPTTSNKNKVWKTDANGAPAWRDDSNTTYSAGTGLSLSGTTFNHSNSVTAGTASEGGSTRTLAFGGTFNIPSVTYDAQGHITGKGSITLTMPANPNTDTKNTTGSTDTSSKIFLVGATSQAANPQTYSDNQVYATNGQLDANKVRVAEQVTLQYNSTTKSLDFIFA